MVSVVSAALDEVAELLHNGDPVTALLKVRKIYEYDLSSWSSEDMGRLHLYAADAHYISGSYEDALRFGIRAVESFEPGKSHALYGSAKYKKGLILLALGKPAPASDDFREAAFAFRRVGNQNGELTATNCLARCAFVQGQYDKARDNLQYALKLGIRSADKVRCLDIRANLGRVLTLIGNFRQALMNLAINSEAEAQNSGANRCNRHGSLAYLLILMRHFEQAGVHLEEKRSLAVKHSLSREMTTYHEYAGELAFWQGKYDEAERHYRDAIKIGTEIAPEGDLISQSHRLLAELQVERGELDDAEKSCEHAHRVAEKITERLELGAIARVRGHIAARLGDVEKARLAFDESIRILEEIGAKYELARAHLLAAEAGCLDQEYRLENIVTARSLFTKIGVEYWSDRAARQFDTLRNPNRAPAVHTGKAKNTSSEKSRQFIAVSPAMCSILAEVEKIKNTNLTILLTGETGVGKDHLAEHIHHSSNRATKPFENVCITTIPADLWESELFGHRKYAYTGAGSAHTGIIGRANGGTVYLNEISEISLELQAKLLQVLQAGEVRPVGCSRAIKLDIRFIAATNRVLSKAVSSGVFRKDLYYRLNGYRFELPPLRERPEDIEPLARYFLTGRGFSDSLIEKLFESNIGSLLRTASWPGNVRQLETVMDRLTVLVRTAGDGDLGELAEKILATEGFFPDPEKGQLISILKANAWNQRATARQLGISEGLIRKKMRRMKINPPNDN